MTDDLQTLGAAYARVWSSGDPAAVASFFAEGCTSVINAGEIVFGPSGVARTAASFFAAFPDLVIRCDDFRVARDHAVFVWTLEGHHAETRNFVRVGGWEEFDLDEDGKIAVARGWFDAADYDRQIAGGA